MFMHKKTAGLQGESDLAPSRGQERLSCYDWDWALKGRISCTLEHPFIVIQMLHIKFHKDSNFFKFSM